VTVIPPSPVRIGSKIIVRCADANRFQSTRTDFSHISTVCSASRVLTSSDRLYSDRDRSSIIDLSRRQMPPAVRRPPAATTPPRQPDRPCLFGTHENHRTPQESYILSRKCNLYVVMYLLCRSICIFQLATSYAVNALFPKDLYVCFFTGGQFGQNSL